MTDSIDNAADQSFRATQSTASPTVSFSSKPATQASWRRIVVPALLCGMVTLFYLPSISNDFIYDDHTLILLERRPQHLGDLWRVFTERHWPNLPYYRPVARLTIVVQKMLHGDDARPYHAFNALLMGMLTAVAYVAFRSPTLRIAPRPAIGGALLVAAHPIASSCVYPICSGRETMLPAFFMLLALAGWLRAGRLWYAVAIAALGAALLSKEQAVVLPAVFLAADALRLTPLAGSSWARGLRRYAPVIALCLAYLGIRVLLFGGSGEHTLKLFDQPILMVLSVFYGLQTVFAPFVPLLYEPLPDAWLSGRRLLWALAIAGLFGWLVFRAHAAQQRVAAFWLAWIILVSLPTANLLKQETVFDERYLLLALVGTMGLAGTLVSASWHLPAVRWSTALIAGILWSFGSISQQRAQYFANDFAFLEQWRATSPSFDYAGNHWQIARFRLSVGNYTLAAAHAAEALNAAPTAIPARVTLGEALLAWGRSEEAEAEFQAAASQPGGYFAGLAGLARVAEKRGDWRQAAEQYSRVMQQPPIVDETARRYAWLLATCPDETVRNGREAVRWARLAVDSIVQTRDIPNGHLATLRAAAFDTLAAALAEAGQFDEAVQYQAQALNLAEPAESGSFQARLEAYQAGRPHRAALAP